MGYSAGKPANGTKRVVVFALDGVRVDVLRQARTPVIDELASNGCFLTFDFDGGTRAISGPGWSTVATGVVPARHGVIDNDFSSYRFDEWPDIFTRLAQVDARARTYVGGGWAPLLRDDCGGPLFRHVWRGFMADVSAEAGTRDDQVMKDAGAVLGQDDVRAAFVYFEDPDAVAHSLGTGVPYREAIESTDRRVGYVLDAVRARPRLQDEIWTVIALTDHGHRDGGGHGSPVAEAPEVERRCWLAATGPRMGGCRRRVSHADVAVEVLLGAGVEVREEWALDGRGFGRNGNA